MTVYRDAHGVPHVRAGSLRELAFEQGRACALDRLWQIEIERMRGEGRTAACLGSAGLEWDVFARRARIADVARRAYECLDDESRDFVDAYVDGVNASIDGGARAPELDRLGVSAERWQPWTPLAVFLVQHILFGHFPSKLWRNHVRAVVPDALALFNVEGLPGGSNAFACGPGRTTTGRPIVAGDPHRTFEAPNVYAQVRLACPEFDVVGFTFPGVPGVQHFAHTGSVAWGITNAVADYQDLRRVRLDDPDLRGHVETIDVRDGAPVTVGVLVGDAGPVIIGLPGGREGLALLSPSWLLGDLGFGALLPLLRARTVGDVDDALRQWVEPVNNVVIADDTGAVLHRVAGRVPERGEDGPWSGWVDELPRRTVEPGECFATANDRGSAAYDRIGEEFAAPFRVRRIQQLLDIPGPIGVDRAAGMLADIQQDAAVPMLDLLRDLDGLGEGAEQVRKTLLSWDRTMGADDPGATAYTAVRARLVELICAAEPLAPLREGSPYGDLYAPWFDLGTRVAVSLHVWLAGDRPLGIDVRALLAEALVDVAAAEAQPWGDRHRFHPLHALEQFGLPHERTTPDGRLPGDTDCVFAAGWLPGTDMCVRGPVARYVWDLSDRARSRWVVPLGAAGRPDSEHAADQFSAWVAGGTVPVTTDWDQLTEEQA